MYEVEFTLDTTSNVLGYDLSSITVTSNGSDRRVNQHVEVLVRAVGDSSFTSLVNNDYTPATSDGDQSAQVTFTDDAGALAGGVDAIRFRTYMPDNTADGDPNGGTVFAEFDVEGTPTIPEPASLALMGLGGLAMLRRRR